MKHTLLKVFEVSKIAEKRTQQDVHSFLVEEVGELSTEIMIKNGKKKREPGKDGIIGEAIDAIICAMDILYLEDPYMQIEDFENLIESKLEKWKNKQLELRYSKNIDQSTVQEIQVDETITIIQERDFTSAQIKEIKKLANRYGVPYDKLLNNFFQNFNKGTSFSFVYKHINKELDDAIHKTESL